MPTYTIRGETENGAIESKISADSAEEARAEYKRRWPGYPYARLYTFTHRDS